MITAPHYPNIAILFNVNNSLNVQADPNTVDMSNPGNTKITIFSTSPLTHNSVTGKVFVTEGSRTDELHKKEIGSTNTPIEYHFVQAYIFIRGHYHPPPLGPEVRVAADP